MQCINLLNMMNHVWLSGILYLYTNHLLHLKYTLMYTYKFILLMCILIDYYTG